MKSPESINSFLAFTLVLGIHNYYPRPRNTLADDVKL